jgi:hypothetical protein
VNEPYFSRHCSSSRPIKTTAPTVIIIVNNKKTHEAEAIVTPKRNREVVIYMGCFNLIGSHPIFSMV